MKLYFDTLLNPRKACAVAKYLKSPGEFVAVDVGKGQHRTPQFKALNPNAKVPLLVDGGVVLWESSAIICHLAKKSPLRPVATGRKANRCAALAAVGRNRIRAAGRHFLF